MTNAQSHQASYHKSLLVIGGGGHAKVLIDTLLLTGCEIAGVLDPRLTVGTTILGTVTVLGDDNILMDFEPETTVLVNGLGSLPGNNARRVVYQRHQQQGYQFIQVIHPHAIVSAYARLAPGVQVMAGTIVQPGTEIGENSIINTSASIDHDCQIGTHVHIAPGAVLSGNVTVGDNVHIGTGAHIIQGISIGNEAVIAAGAVVTQSVAVGTTVYPPRSTK